MNKNIKKIHFFRSRIIFIFVTFYLLFCHHMIKYCVIICSTGQKSFERKTLQSSREKYFFNILNSCCKFHYCVFLDKFDTDFFMVESFDFQGISVFRLIEIEYVHNWEYGAVDKLRLANFGDFIYCIVWFFQKTDLKAWRNLWTVPFLSNTKHVSCLWTFEFKKLPFKDFKGHFFKR